MENSSFPPRSPPPRARWLLIAGGALAGLLILALPIAWSIGQAVAGSLRAYGDLLAVLLIVFVALVGAGLIRIVFAYGRRLEAQARQAEIVQLQNGQPVHLLDVSPLAARLAPRTLDRHYDVEQLRAERSQYPQLGSIHQAIRIDAASAPALAAPSQVPPPDAPHLVGDSDWRRWMDRAPHLLIAGRTEAGKSTLATALLTERALGGDTILILDPHYQPGKWSGVPTIGGGNNFEAILQTLPLLIREMMVRYQAFERGRPTEDFERLTILIDEVPAIVDACMDTSPGGRPRIVDPRWQKFAKRLGSEARKVRISVILLTQSTLVQDMLINSQQRENYLRVALGDRARTLLNEEPDRRRRQQLDELLRGQAYPAAMEWRGDFHLLDTSAVPDLAARPINARAWTPPPLAIGQAPPIPPTARVTPPRTAPPTERLPEPTVPEQIVDLLVRRQTWLTSTEIAQALRIDLKVVQTELTPLVRRRAVERRAAARSGGPEKYEYAVNQSINAPLVVSA